MIDWNTDWNLASIPQDLFASEQGRRRGAHRKKFKVKLAPCKGCGTVLGVVQRRHCPVCGHHERQYQSTGRPLGRPSATTTKKQTESQKQQKTLIMPISLGGQTAKAQKAAHARWSRMHVITGNLQD